jgi:hypothetical protein
MSQAQAAEERPMHFVRIGDRAINLDNVAQIELRSYNDCTVVKVYFVGQGYNSPFVLSEAEAKELSNYVDYVAERPISTP